VVFVKVEVAAVAGGSPAGGSPGVTAFCESTACPSAKLPRMNPARNILPNEFMQKRRIELPYQFFTHYLDADQVFRVGSDL